MNVASPVLHAILCFPQFGLVQHCSNGGREDVPALAHGLVRDRALSWCCSNYIYPGGGGICPLINVLLL